MTESAPRRNRIKLALPLYGTVSGTFLQNWIGFGGQVARYDKYTGLTTTQRPYVDVAMNEIAAGALQESSWDYLFVVEQDMIMPDGVVARLANLDPETHPIVMILYFGRAQEDQRPVCGFMRDGILNRLNYEETCKLLPERGGVAGLHRMDVVGMGATAIHRSVFEKWGFTPARPWFRTDYDELGPLGHDVYFCTEAAKLGFPVHVDSSLVAEHIGEWRSNKTTYLATTEFALTTAEWRVPPTMMTGDELSYLAQLAKGKRVLEIGSQYGNSTVAMAQTATQVVAIDWFQGDGHAGQMNAASTRQIFFTHLEQLGVSGKVLTMAAKWEDALPYLAGGQFFDLILLDAFHGEEEVGKELNAVAPLLSLGGLIAVHDYGRFGVKPAVDAFREESDCGLTIVDTLAVLGIDIPPPQLESRIVVPYAGLDVKIETARALRKLNPEFINVGTSDSDYHDLIADLWRQGRSFITVEQDIVPAPGQIEELLACNEPWCAFEYEYPPFGFYAGMGCAKFSSQLLRAEPRAIEITATWHDARHTPKHWCRVDGWLKQYLLAHGWTQHIHGRVEHLHRGRPAHDCATPEEVAAILAAQGISVAA